MGRTRQCPVWVIIGQPIRDVRFAPQADMLTVGTSPLNANLGHQSLLLQRTPKILISSGLCLLRHPSKVDQYTTLITDDPGVVARRHIERITRAELGEPSSIFTTMRPLSTRPVRAAWRDGVPAIGLLVF